MIKATYIKTVTPLDGINVNYISPKILYKIFENDKYLDVQFNIFDQFILDFFEKTKPASIVNKKSLIIYNNLFDYLIKNIKTEYVLVSVNTDIDLLFISKILSTSNIKVVIGGPLTKNLTCDQIRIVLSNYNCNLDNLLIVRPYIGLTTRISKLIKNWKDIESDIKFDMTGCFEVDDYFLKIKPKNYKHTSIQIMLNTKCYWSKCRFCNYCDDFKIDFTKYMNLDKFISQTIYQAKEYDTKIISTADPIINFNKNVKYIFDYCKSNDFYISSFSSIKLLKNKKYFLNVLKYLDIVRIGVESLDDFTLKEFNKGVTYKDIDEVINKFIDYKNKGYKIPFLYLHFIIDSLSYNIKSIKETYNKFVKLIFKLKENKIHFQLAFASLQIFPFSELYNNKWLKMHEKPGSTIFHNFDRIDNNGKKIPLDKDIINSEIYDYIFRDKDKTNLLISNYLKGK